MSANDQLKAIIDLICSRQNVLIAYPAELAQLNPEESGQIVGSSLQELVSNIFPGQLEVKKLDNSKYLLRDKNISHSNYQGGMSLNGQVADLSGKMIPDVVIFQDGENPVISNANGEFSLQVPATKINQSIYFQSLGYVAMSKLPREIGETPVITLTDQPLQLQTITVIEKLPPIRTIAHEGNLKIKNRENGGFAFSPLYASDFIKQVQMLPGIQADDDLDARLKIRGSEANESLILLDGIPVYRTDHFYGIFSSANSNYFSEGTLYKNALPAQYGGRTGGLLSLSSSESATKWHGSAELDLLTASLTLFTPVSSKITWNLGARTSYLNAAELNSFDLTQPQSDFYRNNFRSLSRSERIKTNPFFNFRDLNSKITYTSGNGLKIDLNFFGSYDQLKNNYDIKYSSRINREDAISTEIFRNSENWENLGTSLNLEGILNNNWTIYSNTYFSAYSNFSDIRSMLTVDLPGKDMSSGFSNIQEGKIVSGGSIFYLVNHSEKQEFKFGIDYKYNQAAYSFGEDDKMLLNGKDHANQSSIFFEKIWAKNKNTNFIFGGRSTFYSPTGKLYLDPKFQINHHSGEYLTFKTSIHYANQFTRELNYENRLGQSANYLVMADGHKYPVGTSWQYMLGIDLNRSGWNLDVEFYRKSLDGVLEYSLQMPGIDPNQGFNKSRSYRVFSGKGKITGMDLLLSRSVKKYTGWIAYTLSKSTRQFREIRKNNPFPAENDRRHQFKWVNSYDLGNFTFSANYIFSSGKPYLALDEIPGEIDRRQLESRAFIRNLPSYQRLDLGLDYHFNLAGKKATLGVACFNITDHHNVKYLQYIYSVQADNEAGRPVNTILGTETSLLGRTPNLRFHLDF